MIIRNVELAEMVLVKCAKLNISDSVSYDKVLASIDCGRTPDDEEKDVTVSYVMDFVEDFAFGLVCDIEGC